MVSALPTKMSMLVTFKAFTFRRSQADILEVAGGV